MVTQAIALAMPPPLSRPCDPHRLQALSHWGEYGLIRRALLDIHVIPSASQDLEMQTNVG